MEKTISYLNSKMWYRFLKVIFTVLFLSILVAANWIFIENSRDYVCLRQIYLCHFNFDFLNFVKFFLYGNFIILISFEFIRRSFYYVVLGTIKPKK